MRNFLKNHIINYPTPLNISYLWSFGFLLGLMLCNQILTGIFLAMYYHNDINQAFDSIDFIVRHVNYGWLIRYLHSNGASFFFILLYIHIFKSLYYQSYLYPRHKVWFSGLIIFILSMATAFLGYVLPWGQMSFWGATVITSLFSAIPFIGNDIVLWLWGGFSIENPTLMRFFIFHFLLPFIILGFVFIHLYFLHQVGSSNILNLNVPNQKIKFYPYFFLKDLFAALIMFTLLMYFVCFMPDFFNHPDNYIKANPLSTPAHIVPEWYFLPFYAILRSIESKSLGIIAMFFSIIILFIFPMILLRDKKKKLKCSNFFFHRVLIKFFSVIFILLGWVGQLPLNESSIFFGKILTFLYFLSFIILIFLRYFNYFLNFCAIISSYFTIRLLQLFFVKILYFIVSSPIFIFFAIIFKLGYFFPYNISMGYTLFINYCTDPFFYQFLYFILILYKLELNHGFIFFYHMDDIYKFYEFSYRLFQAYLFEGYAGDFESFFYFYLDNFSSFDRNFKYIDTLTFYHKYMLNFWNYNSSLNDLKIMLMLEKEYNINIDSYISDNFSKIIIKSLAEKSFFFKFL